MDKRITFGFGSSIHTNVVNCITPLPDGSYLTASDDCSIKFHGDDFSEYAINDIKCTDRVKCVISLPCDRLAFAHPESVVIWDMIAHKQLFAIETDNCATICYLPRDKIAVIYKYDIRVYSLRTYKLLYVLSGHTWHITSLVVHPDGLLASASYDKTIKIWDISKRLCVRTLRGHHDYISKLAVLNNGFIVSCSCDGDVRMWDVNKERMIGRIITNGGWCSSLAVLSDSHIAVSSMSGISILDIQSRPIKKILFVDDYESTVSALAVTSEGFLVSGYENGQIGESIIDCLIDNKK